MTKDRAREILRESKIVKGFCLTPRKINGVKCIIFETLDDDYFNKNLSRINYN